MYVKFVLVALAVCAAAGSNHLGTEAERLAKISTVLAQVEMPATLHQRRRLIESHGVDHANTQETFESIVDEREYHFHRSKAILTLRSLGFEQHELPETTAENLVPEFTDASERMMRRLMEADKAYRAERAEHLEILERMTQQRSAARTEAAREDSSAGPRYLGELGPGVHRVAIDGAFSKSDTARRLLQHDIASLGKCQEVSDGYVYSIDAGMSGLTPFGMMESGTKCTCDAVQPRSDNAAGSKVAMPGRWCKCKENEKHISFTTYSCDAYPGLAPGSECTINTTAFPKSIRCDYQIVTSDMMSTTVATEFKVGYGATGAADDLVADLYGGVATGQLPVACPMIPKVGGFPNLPGYMARANAINAMMALCNMMSYAADSAVKLQPAMDIGQTLMGPRGAGTIDLVPFQFKYPDSFPTKGAPLEHLARIPLMSTATLSGVDTVGLDLSDKVCLSKIGDKLKEGKGGKRTLRAVGAALGMIGADFCFQLTDMDTSTTDLTFGMKLFITAFDKTGVNINNFLDLLPKAWNTMTKSLTGGLGIKDLMDFALNQKPLESCGTTICGEYATLSLGSKLTELITDLWPAEKLSQEIDVGAIVGSIDAMKGVMKDATHFKLANMFKNAAGTGRRLLSSSLRSVAAPTVHRLAAGALAADGSIIPPQHQRQLQADTSYPLKYKNFLLDGSQCTLSFDAMPKSITCVLKLKLGAIELDLSPEFELTYDLNGVDMVVIARAKVKLMLGSAADYGDVGSTNLLAGIDIGGLIDDALTGTISILPLGINFPKEGMFEIARVPVSTLKAQGSCLGNMEDIAPESQKAEVKHVGGVISNVVGFFGGDVCTMSPGLDVSDGFKLDVNGLMKMFDKEQINVYPIIDAIKEAEPSTSTIISAIQTVFGDQIKTAMNEAAKAVMPDKIDFTVNMGKLIAANGDAAKADAGFAGDIVPGSTRRLLVRSTPPGRAGDDGVFNMGYVPASSNPDSKDSGSPDGDISPAATATAGAPVALLLILAAVRLA